MRFPNNLKERLFLACCRFGQIATNRDLTGEKRDSAADLHRLRLVLGFTTHCTGAPETVRWVNQNPSIATSAARSNQKSANGKFDCDDNPCLPT
jgi:hypothetical protein